MAMLRERKRKILETYETERVEQEAAERFRASAEQIEPPPAPGRGDSARPSRNEQLYDLERLWYALGDERGRLAGRLLQPGGPPGRQVSGRRTGGQVRVHRPHADDHSPGAGDQGGTGRRSTGC